MHRVIPKKTALHFYESFIRNRKTYFYKDFLQKSQWWSLEQIQQFQWNELEKLLNHAYLQVPYWNKLFKQNKISPSDIRSFKDFSKLPILTKDIINKNRPDMVARNYAGRLIPSCTGGSTGEPLQFYITDDSYQWATAVSGRGYGWAGCTDSVKSAYIWGAPIKKEGRIKRLKIRFHNYLLQRSFFNSFDFTEENVAKCLNKLNRMKPDVIIGYTSALITLAEYVNRYNFHMLFCPKSIINAAEPLHESNRVYLQNTFGCRVFNSYGSREFMSIAMECEKFRGLHIACENLYVECVREEETRIGRILITDLHNYGMPFIRYDIGDTGELDDKICACGRGLPLLKEIAGRLLDRIKTPDGKVVPGEFFPHLMKEFPDVKKFQAVQQENGSLRIRVVPNSSYNIDTEAIIIREIKRFLGNDMIVFIEKVKEIKLEKSGKFRVTISDVWKKNV